MPMTEEERRERKNARQKEYSKETGYAAQAKYEKTGIKRVVLKLSYNKDGDMIDYLESKESTSGYLRDLIRADMNGLIVRSGI